MSKIFEIPKYITSITLVNLVTSEQIKPYETRSSYVRYSPIYLHNDLELRLRIDFSKSELDEPILKVNIFKGVGNERKEVKPSKNNKWHYNYSDSERVYTWSYEFYILKLKTEIGAFSSRNLYSKGR